MKEMNHTKLKSSSEFMASQQLKKMIPQLLLSVSIFSFIFSYSSLYSSSSSSLMLSPKLYYISANYLQLLSQALNKNCLFLICNGLLVIVAKTSGFIHPPSGFDVNDMLQKKIGDGLQESLREKYVLEACMAEPEEEEEKEEKKKLENLQCLSESPKDQVSIFIAESEEEGGKDESEADQSRKCWLFDDDDDGEEVVEEREDQVDVDDDDDDDDEEEEDQKELSTEELNQKFEDFIRRMKEEIRINEARQELVMVK